MPCATVGSTSQCCPSSSDSVKFMDPTGRIVTCGQAFRWMSRSTSNAWTDSQCQNMKTIVEGTFQHYGCECEEADDGDVTRNTRVPNQPPTRAPTPSPTNAPTPSPTNLPTRSPTNAPTPLPTPSPTGPPSMRPIVNTVFAPVAEPSTDAPIAPTDAPMSAQVPRCTERDTVENICDCAGICDLMDMTCWVDLCEEDVVRLPSGDYVKCHEAFDLYLFSSITRDYSDNDCYIVLLGLKSACACETTTDSTTESPTLPDIVNTDVPGECFPGSAVVTVRGKGAVDMKDLQIGDWVLTNSRDNKDDYYEPVYSFGHYEPRLDTKTPVLTIHTTTTSSKTPPLQLSPTHMIQTPTQGFVAAHTLKKGDTILHAKRHKEVIQSIQISYKQDGLHAPFTPSGQLVVNDVQVSSFIAMTNYPKFNQWLAHSFEFPHRVMCHYLGSCLDETYDDEGLSSFWVTTPFRFAQWFLQQDDNHRSYESLLKRCLWGFLLFIFGIFTMVEQMVQLTVYGMLIWSGLLLVLVGRRRSHANKLSSSSRS